MSNRIAGAPRSRSRLSPPRDLRYFGREKSRERGRRAAGSARSDLAGDHVEVTGDLRPVRKSRPDNIGPSEMLPGKSTSSLEIFLPLPPLFHPGWRQARRWIFVWYSCANCASPWGEELLRLARILRVLLETSCETGIAVTTKYLTGARTYFRRLSKCVRFK